MKEGTHLLSSGAGGVVTIQSKPGGAVLRRVVLGNENSIWLPDEALANLKDILA
jgi:hypothetical protein